MLRSWTAQKRLIASLTMVSFQVDATQNSFVHTDVPNLLVFEHELSRQVEERQK